MSLEIPTALLPLIPFNSVSIFPVSRLTEKDIELSADFKLFVSLVITDSVKWLDILFEFWFLP